MSVGGWCRAAAQGFAKQWQRWALRTSRCMLKGLSAGGAEQRPHGVAAAAGVESELAHSIEHVGWCRAAAGVDNEPTGAAGRRKAAAWPGVEMGVRVWLIEDSESDEEITLVAAYSTTSTYASIGAVASLFDISCLEKSDFAEVQTKAFKTWSKASAKTKATSIGATVGAPNLLGFHYFVTSPSGTGLSPKRDFTSTGKFAGNATAFVLAAKVGDMAAPTNPTVNVDWLALLFPRRPSRPSPSILLSFAVLYSLYHSLRPLSVQPHSAARES
ncbi:hypothetical protein GGX14DRAFT_579545 [Mycena pura]|uniref:Uncharacterized protein n=1 Tax=Mycena pura TaxID=153505 RepID=A0AAD6Y1Z3_9AGAR|nr:hypothetical protein GGX14DRAFT_579545 [Mycena pura]